MHERTQRAVARLLFVFCCAVPTLFVATSIVITWTPWYKSRVLAELTYNLHRETGLGFRIDAFAVDAPGKYTLEGVRLIDPETGDKIATVRTIDYLRESDRIGIALHQPELQSAGLAKLWAAFHDRLLRTPGHTIKPISLALRDLTIHSRTGSLPFSSLTATLSPEDRNVRLIARAENSRSTDGPNLRLNLLRNREGRRPLTELVLSTDDTALPCSVLAEYSKAFRKLGPDAKFSGSLTCTQSASGWTYDLSSCSLTQMNLSYLTEELPHRVTGRAEVHLQRAVIRPGDMVNLVGTVKAEGLRMGLPLLSQLRYQLGWEMNEVEIASHPDGLECNLAAVHFDITDESMSLSGVCDKFHSGVAPNIALFSRGVPLARTVSHRVDSQRITTILSPPSRSLASWNQILLPTAPAETIASDPRGEARGVREWSGNEPIKQR